MIGRLLCSLGIHWWSYETTERIDGHDYRIKTCGRWHCDGVETRWLR